MVHSWEKQQQQNTHTQKQQQQQQKKEYAYDQMRMDKSRRRSLSHKSGEMIVRAPFSVSPNTGWMAWTSRIMSVER